MATKDKVLETLKQVRDPEVGLNIVDMGLVYDVTIEGELVEVTMTLTSPACPYGPQIINGVKTAPLGLEGVEEVGVQVVWSPPWDPDTMMSEEAKDALGIF
jgi:metal-sulfur cluster biosynthetic enzyme